jgi:hypothetical protein
VVVDIRDCEQCGTSFVPRREHARFCGAGCRAVWNHEHMGDLKAGESALMWSITAMSDAAERLSRVRAVAPTTTRKVAAGRIHSEGQLTENHTGGAAMAAGAIAARPGGTAQAEPDPGSGLR